MRLLNVIPFKVGDRVETLQPRVRTRWTTITVEDIRVATESDWCFPGQMCVWWNRGSSRWPVTLCRKVQQ